jgi:ABC-type branched-subunit amino acid transport system permease subunit
MVLVLVFLALAFALVTYVARSPVGRSMKALREGDEVPLALGKSAGGLRIRVMAIGGVLGGLAGALFAHYNAYISPEYFLPLETFIVWAMVILGGPGNFVGALVGTLVIQILYNSTRFIAPLLGIDPQVLGPLRMIVIAALIIIVILFMPRGILPERRRRYG